jgi:hypothetical protein
MTPKRKKIQDKVIEIMSLMDPTQINAKKYASMFNGMSDQQFSKWITDFLKDEKSNFRLDIEEFGSNGSRVLKFENVTKAAEALQVPLFEYVYMPHISANPKNPIRTKQKVLVGYLNIKRVQQFVTKKTGLTMSDSNRDEITGRLKGKSKGGVSTAIENEVLAGMGADQVMSEFLGSRADNVQEYDAMLQSIAERGNVKLEDIKTTTFDKPSLLLADTYLMCMGLKTDLVSEAYYSIDKIRAAMGRE